MLVPSSFLNVEYIHDLVHRFLFRSFLIASEVPIIIYLASCTFDLILPLFLSSFYHTFVSIAVWIIISYHVVPCWKQVAEEKVLEVVLILIQIFVEFS